jgi:hypothetical protein
MLVQIELKIYSTYIRPNRIMNTYSYDKKEKLARKIEKLKSKKHLVDVFKIIKRDPNTDEVLDNISGLFMFFHKLNDDTYIKIEKYLKSLKKTNEISTCSEFSDSMLISDSFTDTNNESNVDNGPKQTELVHDAFTSFDEIKSKYSNKEKCIIKRKLYDEALIDMHNSSDEVPNSV